MVLGKSELEKLMENSNLITPASSEFIKNVHIDLRLSPDIYRYTSSVDLKQNPAAEYLTISDEHGYELKPGDFIIGSTYERVSIPEGYWGFIETKGNIARAGLSSHNTDGHIDPGYKGVVTLEIKNQNTVPVKIYPHIPFVQLFIFPIEGSAPLYNGKYQNSTLPTIYKCD
jgi:dCTP deaminase